MTICNFEGSVPKIQVTEQDLSEWMGNIVDLVSKGAIAYIVRSGKPVAALISAEDLMTHPNYKDFVPTLEGGW